MRLPAQPLASWVPAGATYNKKLACDRIASLRHGGQSPPAPHAWGTMLVYRDTSIMDIEVKFDGEEIIVTKPGTDFMLAYWKRPDSPTLKLTRSWVDPHTTSPAGE